ncbi:MAG: ethylbenzene dehydrogenase-related protein [Candidatus Poribacteria bacterium]
MGRVNTAFQRGEAVPFPRGKSFQVGDTIPGYVLSVPDGSRGEVRRCGKWQSGIWTVELSRKLVTDHNDDVQFDDFSKPYQFAVAVVDNASGAEHSFSGVLRLQFEK